MPAAGRVRPVAPELSRAVIDAHVEAFEDGLDINEACQVVGHGTALYYRWAKAGAEEGASDLLREFFDRVVCGRTPLRAVRARTDHIPERLSLDHFREWARGVVLDTGDRWVLEGFQEEIAFDILEGPAREIWLVIPEGNAKALDLDTPLPTPGGWTSMGDVAAGDWVLGSDGRPVRVTLATEVMHDRPCFEVRFSDGVSVVADADHLWEVEGAHDHYRRQVLTTRGLLDRGVVMGSGARRWRIRTAARVAVDAALPIDPYVLGAWLGDGASACGRVTNIDGGVWERIAAAGYSIGKLASVDRARTHTVLGLAPQLRVEGLIGAKRIPDAYFLGSESQRLALMQGLIDTDGSVSAAGQVTYSTTSRALADGVRRLAWSLGRPCHLDEDRARLDGRDCGPVFRLTISCAAEHGLAHLARKAERMKATSPAADFRRITAIVPVRSRPVRCIQVDAADRLYLAGEGMVPTHNTTLMAGVALYHAEHTVSASVPVGASSRDQAKILYRQAEGMILRSPGFGRRFRCYEGTRLIRALSSMGRIQIYAADEKTADGVIPTLALLDELHRHRDLGLYRTWRGKLGKRRGRMVAISTAGEPGSEFEDTRDKIRREAGQVTEDGAHVRAVGGGVVLHDWAVRDRRLADDMEAVKAANPLASITVEDLQEKHDSPTTEPEHWLRMTCNIPARVSGQAITAAQWDGLCEPGVVADRSAWSIGFMDLGWVIDCSALGVLVWEGERRRVIAGVRVITPPVDEEQVVTALLDLQEEFGPVGWVYDPNAGAQQMAQQLEKGENLRQIERGLGPLTFFEHPQDPALMALAASRLDEAIRGGLLVHDGNPALRAHVLNAVKKTVGAGEKWRYDRPPDAKGRRRGKYPIDALTGVVMGHSVAVAEQVTRNVMPLVRAVG